MDQQDDPNIEEEQASAGIAAVPKIEVNTQLENPNCLPKRAMTTASRTTPLTCPVPGYLQELASSGLLCVQAGGGSSTKLDLREESTKLTSEAETNMDSAKTPTPAASIKKRGVRHSLIFSRFQNTHDAGTH